MGKLKIRRSGVRRRQRGAAAVEFALVAPVFLVMMFSLFEIGWFFFSTSIVDASASTAARLVRTGQVQRWTVNQYDGNSSINDETDRAEALFDAVCRTLSGLGDCDQNMTVEVESFASFAALEGAADNPPTCADATPEELADIIFSPGGELQIVRLRICFIYRTVNPMIGFEHIGAGVDLSEGDTNRRRLITSMIFRNEPYERNLSEEG